MMNLLYSILCSITVFFIVACNSKENKLMVKESIFGLEQDILKQFEGQDIESFLHKLKESPTGFYWNNETQLRGGTYYFDNKDLKTRVYVFIAVDTIKYQAPMGSKEQWDKKLFEKETIARISLLRRGASDEYE